MLIQEKLIGKIGCNTVLIQTGNNIGCQAYGIFVQVAADTFLFCSISKETTFINRYHSEQPVRVNYRNEFSLEEVKKLIPDYEDWDISSHNFQSLLKYQGI